MKRRLSPLRRFVENLLRANRDRELRGFVYFILVLLAIGTVFYTAVEHWSPLDAFYHSAMIITTIGMSDVMPHTVAGKLFTVAYVFVGLGSVLGFVAVFAGHIHGKSPDR